MSILTLPLVVLPLVFIMSCSTLEYYHQEGWSIGWFNPTNNDMVDMSDRGSLWDLKSAGIKIERKY